MANLSGKISLLGILAYKITLDCSYYYIIGPIFEYEGFENEFSRTKLIISYILTLLLFPYIKYLYKQTLRPMFSYMTLFLILMSLIPNLSFLVYNNVSESYIFLYSVYWILFFLALKFIPYIKIRPLKTIHSNRLIYFYLLILAGAVVTVSFIYTGFRLHFNLDDVYDLRSEAREYNYPTIFGYLLPAAGTLLPILLLYFFERKKYFVSVFIIFIILLNFGIAGHKTVLVSLIATILFYFFYNNNLIKFISWVLSGIGIIGIIEYVVSGSFIFISLIYRRVLFVPAYLNLTYYDFFSTHTPDYFRQGFLRHFGAESQYDQPIALVIGETYIGPGCNANNGLFSDSLLSLGTVGPFIFPILLAFVIKLIDSVSRAIPPKMLIIPAIIITFSFISTSLTTSLLTGGVLFTMLLFYFFPRN